MGKHWELERVRKISKIYTRCVRVRRSESAQHKQGAQRENRMHSHMSRPKPWLGLKFKANSSSTFFCFFRSRINSMLCHQISQCCELDMMMTEEEEEKKSSRETSWLLETFLLPSATSSSSALSTSSSLLMVTFQIDSGDGGPSYETCESLHQWRELETSCADCDTKSAK